MFLAGSQWSKKGPIPHQCASHSLHLLTSRAALLLEGMVNKQVLTLTQKFLSSIVRTGSGKTVKLLKFVARSFTLLSATHLPCLWVPISSAKQAPDSHLPLQACKVCLSLVLLPTLRSISVIMVCQSLKGA